jgi:hypothetical protein
MVECLAGSLARLYLMIRRICIVRPPLKTADDLKILYHGMIRNLSSRPQLHGKKSIIDSILSLLLSIKMQIGRCIYVEYFDCNKI